MVDVISAVRDKVEREDLKFHPLVQEELVIELNKWTRALLNCPIEKLYEIQAKVAVLDWLTCGRLVDEVLKKQELKRLAEEKAERQKVSG